MRNSNCCPHVPFLVSKKTFKDLSQKKTNLHGEDFVAPLVVVPSDDVKHKLHFDELKYILNLKTT